MWLGECKILKLLVFFNYFVLIRLMKKIIMYILYILLKLIYMYNVICNINI